MSESHYNTLVKQVERCSDHLTRSVDSFKFPKDDEIAADIVQRIRRLITLLDIQALRMLAGYDPYAKRCLAEKKTRDPRRDGKGPEFLEGVGFALEAIKRTPEAKNK